jgi:hypothetical protein
VLPDYQERIYIIAIRIRKQSGRRFTKSLPNPKGRLPRGWLQTQSLNSFYQTDIIISISFPRDVSVTYMSRAANCNAY